MHDKDFQDLIRNALKPFGVDQCDVTFYLERSLSVDLLGHEKISYDVMKTLAELLGTSDINLGYEEEGGGYSEFTPGDPARHWLHIKDVDQKLWDKYFKE